MCDIKRLAERLTLLKKWFPVYLRKIEDIEGLEGKYFEIPFSGDCRLIISDGRLSGKIGELDVVLYGKAKSDYGIVSALNSAHGLDFITEFLKNFQAIKSDVLVAAGQEEALEFVSLLAG